MLSETCTQNNQTNARLKKPLKTHKLHVNESIEDACDSEHTTQDGTQLCEEVGQGLAHFAEAHHDGADFVEEEDACLFVCVCVCVCVCWGGDEEKDHTKTWNETNLGVH